MPMTYGPMNAGSFRPMPPNPSQRRPGVSPAPGPSHPRKDSHAMKEPGLHLYLIALAEVVLLVALAAVH